MSNLKMKSTLLAHEIPENKIDDIFDAANYGFFDMHTDEIKSDVFCFDIAALKDAADVLTIMSIEENNVKGVDDVSKVVYDCNRLLRNIIIDRTNKTPENMISLNNTEKAERKFDKETAKLLKELEESEF